MEKLIFRRMILFSLILFTITLYIDGEKVKSLKFLDGGSMISNLISGLNKKIIGITSEKKKVYPLMNRLNIRDYTIKSAFYILPYFVNLDIKVDNKTMDPSIGFTIDTKAYR